MLIRIPVSPLRPLLRSMLREALRSTDAGRALQRSIRKDGERLTIGRRTYNLRDYGRVVVVGAGKASAAMARAIEPILGRRLDRGLVVVKYGHRLPTRRIAVVEAGHPFPDRAGLTAARRIVELIGKLTAQDLLIVLLSGGASSLMPAPVDGVTLADKQRVTDLLLRCGAGIVEVNAVRKHLSNLKGGRLAALTGATILTFILSDVIGDDLSAVGSGPTAPDPTSYRDAVTCLHRYGLWSSVPHTVRRHLTRGLAGRLTDTPKPGAQLFRRVRHIVIGNNAAALDALAATARAAGWRTCVLPPITNEARTAGAAFGVLAKKTVMKQRPAKRPYCLIAGGETTVTVRGGGKGGRAQEFALAAAKAIAGLRGVYVAAIATDGTDGPTEAAGALVGGETWDRAERIKLDLDAALKRNDSYRALKRLNCLVMTGPTATNVNDLYLLFVF